MSESSEVHWWPSASTIREVDPSEFTDQMWTGADGDTIAAVRRLKDGSLYVDCVTLADP